MSLSGAFNPAGRGQPPLRAKRLPPFSLRLTNAERARLAVEAAGAPLGAYIKAKVLGGNAPPVRVRRSGLPVADRQALAQVLARLGAARLSANLNQLAFAANCGSLAVSTETIDKLLAAIADIQDVRRLLMVALGLKEDGRP